MLQHTITHSSASQDAPDNPSSLHKTEHVGGFYRVRKRRGMLSLLARELGLHLGTVAAWQSVPLRHVFRVARIMNVRPEALRPDFFADDPLRNENQEVAA